MTYKRPDIYTQHDKAFSAVSAYVVLNSASERVATVALKFPRDGAGRLYAYVHWIGLEMVRGWAGGIRVRQAVGCLRLSRAAHRDWQPHRRRMD